MKNILECLRIKEAAYSNTLTLILAPTLTLTLTLILALALTLIVGTLEDGYIRKVPLPRVPRIQSASLVASAMIHKNPAHTGYLPIARIPVWSNPLGLLTGLGSCIERCILPFSPVRLM